MIMCNSIGCGQYTTRMNSIADELLSYASITTAFIIGSTSNAWADNVHLLATLGVVIELHCV